MEDNMELFNRTPTMGISKRFGTALTEPEAQQRLINELLEMYTADKKGYTIEFLQCLAQIFKIKDEKLDFEAMLDFSTKTCFHHEHKFGEDDPFMQYIFKFLFSFCDLENPNIRLRICMFVVKILNQKRDKKLSQDLLNEIKEAMLKKLNDSCDKVRAQAVIALGRIQLITEECHVMTSLVFHLVFHIKYDPSPLVRENIVKHIVVTNQVLPYIINRINDIDERVKQAALGVILDVKATKFTIEQRQTIIIYGMRAQQAKIRNFVLEELLKVWLICYDYNLLCLYESLSVFDLDEDIVKTISFQIFKKQRSSFLIGVMKQHLNVDKVVIMDRLTPEIVTYWYYLAKYLSLSKIDEEVNEDQILLILPQFSSFMEYISEVSFHYESNSVQNIYMKRMLLKLTSLYSLFDENERNELKEFCFRMLCKESELSYVPVLAELIQKVVSDVRERCKLLCEIVNGVRQGSHENIIVSEESEESEEIEDDGLLGFKHDPETLIKCLTVILEFLKSADVEIMHPELLSLKDFFVLPCLNENNTDIKNLILQIISLMSIRNLTIAREVFFYLCLQISDPSLSFCAIGGVFDILVIHGINIYNITEETKNKPAIKRRNLSLKDLFYDPTLPTLAVKKLVGLLMSLLENSDIEIKLEVGVGLAKLMLAGRITSSLVFGVLALKWFSEKSECIRQSLGLFFSEFSLKKSGACDIILGCFAPTLKTIEKAKLPDPTAEINPYMVVKLILHLLRDRKCTSQSKVEELGSYHYRLALIICKEIMSGKINTFVLVKALSQLKLIHSDGKHASSLLNHLRQIKVKNDKDNRMNIMLLDFFASVVALKKNYQEELQLTNLKSTQKNASEQPRASTQSLPDTPDSTEIEQLEIMRGCSPVPMTKIFDDEEECLGTDFKKCVKGKSLKKKKVKRASISYRTRAYKKKKNNKNH